MANKTDDNKSQSGMLVAGELEKALKEAESNLKGWQRAVADFENYKRRDQDYHVELITFGQEQIINQFLALAEDLDRILTHVPKDLDKLDEWQKGLEGVRQNLHNALHDLGVERIVAVGEKFNPDEHEAVEQVEGESDDVVAEEISSGYKFKNRLLKPARVKVYKKIISN